MFQRIDFKGLRQSPTFGYAADVPFFSARRKLEFKPGLNVLYGPNGSGKSTVLQILGETMCATQGGMSAITEGAIRQTVDHGFGARGTKRKSFDKLALNVVHDGQPVIFCDPRNSVGLSGGAFDDDFFQEGVNDLLNLRHASHGQASAARMNAALAVLEAKARLPTSPRVGMDRKHVNEIWVEAIDLVEARMKGSIEKGQFTLLLDEPEANFSLQWQSRLWGLIARPDVAKRLQVIVASHSPFVLGIPHANYIDLVQGYREEMQGMLTSHFARASEAATA